MAIEFSSEAQRESFQNDVLDFLYDNYHDEDGKNYQGQSVSFVLTQLRTQRGGRGWKGIGVLNDFETLLEVADFKVLPLRNSRNQKARVVTL